MTTGNNQENPYGDYVPGQYSQSGNAAENTEQNRTEPTGSQASPQAAEPQPSSNPYSQVHNSYSQANPAAAGASDATAQQANQGPYSQQNQQQYGQGAAPTYASAYQYQDNSVGSPYNYTAYGYQQAKPKGLAIASLVLGILALLSGWLIIGGLFGLVGLVLGIIALVNANKGTAGGKGMAIGGIITSVLGILSTIAMIAFSGWIYSNFDECTQYSDQTQVEQCLNDQLGTGDLEDAENS